MEIWKPVIGFEGIYEVSNKGRVRSLDRSVFIKKNHKNASYNRSKKGAQVKGRPDKDGYLCIYLGYEGGGRYKKVHRLVAEAFVKNPQGKKYVNHIDGNKTNNIVENLSWVTAKENTVHALSNGLIKRGKRGPMMDAAYVVFFRFAANEGINYKKLSDIFGFSRVSIARAASGMKWKSIHEALNV